MFQNMDHKIFWDYSRKATNVIPSAAVEELMLCSSPKPPPVNTRSNLTSSCFLTYCLTQTLT
ncbi:hypothetical protein E2C01_027033 [Portunus trituberculatus]|uniref:Uncharacterized protein n=1 Tax=Portunus trituberculatus TaxID=210409 RepID=A0A5B7EJU1_PORTR|nr:hypothetical protein [Portunus trituberculatus]